MTLGSEDTATDRIEDDPTDGRLPLPILIGAGLAAAALLAAVAFTPPAPWRAALAGVGLGGLATVIAGARALRLRLHVEQERTRELAPARSRLQALIDASPLAITAGDLDGRVTLWSAAAEAIFGWTADEVVGRPYPAVPDEEKEGWRELRDRVLSGGTVSGVHGQRVTRSGDEIEVSVSAAPVRAGGEIVGTVALVEDLSRSSEASQELEELETQLRHAQKLEVVGRLAAGIAHDFNNLLTAIRGNADLILANESGDPDMAGALREISRSADRAAALTRQLLSYTHQGPVETRPVAINRVITGMRALMERLISETVQLDVVTSVDAGAVLMDPGQIEQVLMNLVVNARDALPGGGRITVRTGTADVSAEEAERFPYEVRPGPYTVITVADNGVGMAPEIADRIFEPFFTTKPTGVGTGLGLSTVYSIVKQARGHIHVDTSPDEGTRFEVYLPRAEEEFAAPDEDRKVTPGDGGSETILVVEDEEAVLSLAKRTLERQGYRVLTALSGRKALAVANEHPGEIHALFCDVVMPDLSGREVAERVRKSRPFIEILMTSGWGENQLIEEGVLQDVAFLPKPYTPADLTRRIRELLGTPASS